MAVTEIQLRKNDPLAKNSLHSVRAARIGKRGPEEVTASPPPSRILFGDGLFGTGPTRISGFLHLSGLHIAAEAGMKTSISPKKL